MHTFELRAMRLGAASIAVAGLVACGGGDDAVVGLPQLSAAQPGTLSGACSSLASFTSPNTSITSATDVAAGTLTVGGTSVPAHCLVSGAMYQRTGVNGNYAIGFEMRLPQSWNGRFFYQGNGGLDGSVSTAVGESGGGPLTNALLQGFAVISSDAGHTGAQTAQFGFDPQARLDYGYQAAEKLTPMAKSLIKSAYGREPDRSYFGGCSNGGRHTLVATSRLPSQYDGFLAGAPGYNLPKAATAQIWGAQKWYQAATSGATTTSVMTHAVIKDLSTAFTSTERAMVGSKILAKCDALDLAADGIVSDTAACQKAFDVATDVPTCSASRDGTCLTAQQKTILKDVFAGAKTTSGTAIYNSFPFDSGISSPGWSVWKFDFSQALDPLAVGTVFRSPAAFIADPMTADVDALFAGISATDATFTVSGLGFMTPPNPSDLSTLKNRGAKVMVYHGVSDPIFSYDDSVSWYKNLANANNGNASNFARLFPVPGMTHCSGGPATDQFDMLSSLVNWVERGVAPDSVVATARGTGNAGGVNAEVPSAWAANRTRPLCAYPKVAKYSGSGSIDLAYNFTCQ